jgi:hypothetical protein
LCYYDGSLCDGYACGQNGAKGILDSNSNSLASNFDDEKSYLIRDNILENSLFGLKYKSYYYDSSFSKMNFSLSNAIGFAELIPEIYFAYDNIKNNNSQAVLISEMIAQKILSLLDDMIANNSESIYFVKILNDVKSDISYLKNKTVGEVNDAIY